MAQQDGLWAAEALRSGVAGLKPDQWPEPIGRSVVECVAGAEPGAPNAFGVTESFGLLGPHLGPYAKSFSTEHD